MPAAKRQLQSSLCRRLNIDILCQGFESLAIRLNHRNGYMASFAVVDVPDDAGFAFMYATDDFACSAVPKFAWWFSFHLSDQARRANGACL